MPAILSAIFSAIYATFATKATYGSQLIEIFPAMQNVSNTTESHMHFVIGVSKN